MTDIFRSAISYLSANTPNPLGGSNSSSAQQIAGGTTDHPLVGSTVEIEGERFKVRSLLAEGGFALVFAVQNQRGEWLALKRQLAADRQAADAITQVKNMVKYYPRIPFQEIAFLQELSGHPSIVSYIAASHLGPKQTSHGRAEFLLLTELCSGGPLINVMTKGELSPEQVCKIFHAAATAVRHMHDRNPPITHR